MNLRKKRILAGISRKELAAQTGLSKYKIELYERGISEMPLNHAAKLEIAINLISSERVFNSLTTMEQFIQVRKAKGFTHKTLSEAAKVSNRTISSFEKGDATITLNTLEKMTSVLGVNIRFVDKEL